MRIEPCFLSVAIAEAIHSMLIESSGGRRGTRDSVMLQSALDRAVNRWHYESAEIPRLAADYAFGIARNHPFMDGNKRCAFMAAYTFLGLNGYRLLASEAEVVVMFLALAAGEIGESSLAAWFAEHSESAT